jgi:hypothetical protein
MLARRPTSTRTFQSIATNSVSRAFVNEDAGSGGPKRHYALPPRDDPGYDAAAAAALLEAAREGETQSAEEATGYYWGEKRLHGHVRRILQRAERDGDDRLAQLASRFLR